VVAAVQAQFQIHDIGHKRDQKTILVGIHDFTPPFLGTSKIAQFTVTSKFGAGAWLIGSALVLQLAAAGICRRRMMKATNPNTQHSVNASENKGYPHPGPLPSDGRGELVSDIGRAVPQRDSADVRTSSRAPKGCAGQVGGYVKPSAVTL
jgi:hypothetical protein